MLVDVMIVSPAKIETMRHATDDRLEHFAHEMLVTTCRDDCGEDIRSHALGFIDSVVRNPGGNQWEQVVQYEHHRLGVIVLVATRRGSYSVLPAIIHSALSHSLVCRTAAEHRVEQRREAAHAEIEALLDQEAQDRYAELDLMNDLDEEG